MSRSTGGPRTPTGASRSDNERADINADGSELLTVTESGEIAVTRLNGSNPQRVIGAGGYEWTRAAALSVDGSQVFFTSNGGTRIERVSVHGGATSLVHELPNGWTVLPVGPVLADGRLFFVTARETLAEPFVSASAQAIWQINTRETAGTSNAARVTDIVSAWMPDNATVLFYSSRNGSSDLFRQRFDSDIVIPVVTGPGNQSFPRITGDGRWVLFIDDGGTDHRAGIFKRLPLPGGVPENVMPRPTDGVLHCAARGRCVLIDVTDIAALERHNPDSLWGSGFCRDDVRQLVAVSNNARIALGRNDLAGARTELQAFRSGAETSRNPAFIRQAHELAGIVALQEKKSDEAITELEQASNQNPYNLYRLCLAYQAKGDTAKAGQWCGKAARFNSLPQLNSAFVRSKAAKLASGPTS